MLNKRQRQFRKQMKGMEKAKSNQQDHYSYRDQRYTSEKPKKRFRKPLLQIGGAISMLVLIWNLYVFSSSVITGNGVTSLLSSEQLEVHRYIQESTEIEGQLSNAATTLINEYNEKTLTSFRVEETQKNLFELQKKIESDDRRFLPMRAHLDEHFKLVYQLTNVLQTKESNVKFTEINDIIDKQNALLKRRDSVLTGVLESEGIPFERLEDGSISYQYEM